MVGPTPAVKYPRDAIHVDQRTNVHTPGGPPSVGSAEAFFWSLVEAWDHGLCYWAVEFNESVIGFAGIEGRTVLGRDCWNLYYRFTPEVWGQGLATEVASEAVRVAAAVDDSRPVVARTRATNLAAASVAERAGLTRRVDLDHDGYIVFASKW